jgi:glucose-6-phosphate 1-epimerase
MTVFHGPESFRGMPAIRWRSDDGASAVAMLQGAQLVSWIPAGGEECLYLSERSPFEAGRAIRGGIPVCFPQFADRGPLPQHGFARNHPWRFHGVKECEGGARAAFVLESPPQTLELWPHTFRLELAATIGGRNLQVELRVTNTGDSAFDFTAALHTYFRIADFATARLEGLRGVRYQERGSRGVEIESREQVTAELPIDRIYFAAPAATRLEDTGREFHIGQRGFTDTVVWNPGVERTLQMPDMPPDGFRRMWCVEAAAIEPAIRLEPGAQWAGAQVIESKPL